MKKNQNNHFLKLAFEQAKINLGSTGSNPSVGCIVEKYGSVISSGHTSLTGRPHAEFNALNQRDNLKNANVFVTLEPCAHKNNIGVSCAELISKTGISKIFISSFDFDPRTSGKGIEILKKNNIKVI